MGQVLSDIQKLTDSCCCEDRSLEKFRKKAAKFYGGSKGDGDQPVAESSRPEVAPESGLNPDIDAQSPAKRSGMVFRDAVDQLSPQHSIGSSDLGSPDRRLTDDLPQEQSQQENTLVSAVTNLFSRESANSVGTIGLDEIEIQKYASYFEIGPQFFFSLILHSQFDVFVAQIARSVRRPMNRLRRWIRQSR